MKPRASWAIAVTLEFGRPSAIVKRSQPRGGVSRLSIFMELLMKEPTAGSEGSAFGAGVFGAAIADRAAKSATTHATVSFCTMLLACKHTRSGARTLIVGCFPTYAYVGLSRGSKGLLSYVVVRRVSVRDA